MRLHDRDEKIVQKTSKNNPLFLNNSNKETSFSAHFKEINQTVSSSSINSFQSTFQAYTKRDSLIDTIMNSFDVGKITNLHETVKYQRGREVCAGLSQKIKNNIQEISNFFSEKMHTQSIQVNTPLNYESFSLILSCLISKRQNQISPQIQTVYRPLIPSQQNNSSLLQTKPCTIVQSKVDLLLHELFSQKQRKQQIQFYQQAIEIKLNEFFQYIVKDDKFFGLSLQGKAEAILPNLSQLKGQMIDGWPKLQLIQIFFQELKQLQEHRLKLLKIKKAKEDQNNEIKSQNNRSVKSITSSSKRAKYSEPNRGKKQSEPQQWIGSLQ